MKLLKLVWLILFSIISNRPAFAQSQAEREHRNVPGSASCCPQPERSSPDKKSDEEDLVELAKQLTNEDLEWNLGFLGLTDVLSDRAKKLQFNLGWSSRQNWEIRYDWLAGLEDPKRDEICHYMLTSVYDEDWTIAKKYFTLFEWSNKRPSWNAKALFRTEETLPTVEAERQMLVAAWKRRIGDWEDEQFSKDRDGPVIQEAIVAFVKKIDSNPVNPEVLEHVGKIEAILESRKDLKVKPFESLIPGIDPAQKPEGYRILKAAYLAGNMKEQIRTGHGEDCPFAGVRTMVVIYHKLEQSGLIENSKDLDQWLFWFRVDESELKNAVDLILNAEK